MGPRQPPDKRHAAAYEAIFQRPNPTHHSPSQSYPHIPPQHNHPAYQFPPQQFHSSPDRRTSLGSYSHNGYPQPQQLPPGTYRQSYYPPPPHIAQHLPPQPFDNQPPAPYGYPPPAVPRARSLLSNSHSPGIIAPQPEEPPDANPQGLTPAQAYQAQVFNNSGSSGSQSDRNRYRTSPAPPDRNSFPQSQNGASHKHQDPPRLGINLDADDGRLGIDFAGSSGNSSDDGSSELPWARNERTGPHPMFSSYGRLFFEGFFRF